MITIRATEKPKWRQLRWKISNFFIYLARKTKPNNPEVTAFWMQQLQDQIIYGVSAVRVERVHPLDLKDEIIQHEKEE